MAKRVLSIEISHSITRVIEMDYKVKNPKLYNYFSFETPEDTLEEGTVHINEPFVAAMKQGLKQNGIHTRHVVFTITSGRIATREISIPLIKEKKIQALLDVNAQEYFPVDVEKYQLKYEILEKVDTEEKKNYQLIVLAIPNDIVESYKALADHCDLVVEAMDYVGNSVAEGMRPEYAEETVAVVKIEDEVSMITVFHEKKMLFQRSISYGINEAVEKAAKEEDTYLDVMKRMRSQYMIEERLPMGVTFQSEEMFEEDKLKQDITKSLRPLVGNLTRALDFFTARYREVQISKIVLIGLGADCLGMSELLTTELGIPVESFKQAKNITFTKQMNQEEFLIAEYMGCIGAAIKPLELLFPKEENTKIEKANGLHLAGMVCGVCVAASVVMLLVPMIKQMGLKKEVFNLSEEKLKLSYIEEIYQNYEAATTEYTNISTMYESTKTKNEELVSFIEEMEQKMPSDIKVGSFTADGSGVNMTIKVNSKASAAKVLVELRSFQTLAEVKTTGINEVSDEVGNSYVEFAVTCTYQEAGSETVPVEETENQTTDQVAAE